MWLPPPKELVSRPLAGAVRSSDDGRVPDGRDASTMASRLTEAMAGLSAAVAAAQSASATQSGVQSVSAPSNGVVYQTGEAPVEQQRGDADVGAGPSYPSVAMSMPLERPAEGATSPTAGFVDRRTTQ